MTDTNETTDTVVYETPEQVYAAVEAEELDEAAAVGILDELAAAAEPAEAVEPAVLDDEVDGVPTDRPAGAGDVVRQSETGITASVAHRTDQGVALAGDDRPRIIWPHGTYEVLEV